MSGPLSRALGAGSTLRGAVRSGLGAVRPMHRSKIDDTAKAEFADSMDLDEAMRSAHPRANRWDYLLGHAKSGKVVALEPHSAQSHEVKVVVAKKEAARAQLAAELSQGSKVARWFWVASGKVDFVPFEKAVRQLDQSGITFVGKQLSRKHLADL